jgi:ribosomal protein S27AE
MRYTRPCSQSRSSQKSCGPLEKKCPLPRTGEVSLTKLLYEMEEELRIAKAALAGELGFSLCPRCWPPELVTAGRAGRINCPRCGEISYERAA